MTTGEKATDTICMSLHIATMPKVNSFVTVPKVEAYRRMFEFIEKGE